MDFDLSEEQQLLQDTLRRYLAKAYGFERRRQLAAGEGWSREAWAAYAELGITAQPFPAAHGGLDGDGVDVMVVMESLGRALALEPYVPTVVLAGGLLRDAASAAQKDEWLGPIGSGEKRLAFAHHEPGSRYESSRVACRAAKDGAGWRLSGRKAVVLHGAQADALLVSARTAGAESDAEGISLFLVDGQAPGLSRRGYATQDGGRAADLVLDGVRLGAEALVGAPDAALPVLERALDQANAALCAEAVGIMDALNEATLEYLKTRKQFGVPIGRFQALQHRMADMTMHAAQARSMACLAAVRGWSHDAAERARGVAAAKALVGQAARFVGQQAIQLHGGMGVTDELIVSHWFKRLTLINASFGDADHHLGRYSDLLLEERA